MGAPSSTCSCALLLLLLCGSQALNRLADTCQLSIIATEIVELCPSCSLEHSALLVLARQGALHDLDILEQGRVEVETYLYTQLLNNVAEHKRGRSPSSSNGEEYTGKGGKGRLARIGPRLDDEDGARWDAVCRRSRKERRETAGRVVLVTHILGERSHEAA